MTATGFGSPHLEGLERYQLGPMIGRGAMGEVYRARDLSLGRDVALKMLPRELASDERLIARLVREGRLLAKLSHPHIATVHDVFARDGRASVVMELVEGETLRERISRGRLRIDEALAIASQLAAAMSAAHAQGIVHCDLKPANIMLRPDGQVKVLDFGLARTPDPLEATGTDDITLTGDGARVLRGTPAYLSPERVAGEPADRHGDIWSFGCVLFEMLTGQRAFARNSTAQTLATIADGDVDLSRLSKNIPPAVTTVLRLCLNKDRHARLHDLGDARLMLDQVNHPTESARAHGVPAGIKWAAAVGAGVLIATTVSVWRSSWEQPPPTAPLRRLIVPATPNANQPAISPDGRYVAYVADQQLWLTDLSSSSPRALTAKEERVAAPFWSPDGKSIAFFSFQVLSRIRIDGARQSITALPTPGVAGGGTWASDDTIYFADGLTLYRVPASGGTATVHIKADATQYATVQMPHIISNGRGMLVELTLLEGGTSIAAVRDGAMRVVLDGARQQAVGCPSYVDPGWVVFTRQSMPLGTFALRFDLDRLRTSGEPELIAQYAGCASTSRTGTAVMMQGNEPIRTLRWVDQSGRLLETVGEPQLAAANPAIAPDGRRVAATSWRSGTPQIWLHEGRTARLLTEEGGAFWPEWHPDGTLYYATGLDEGFEIRRLPAGLTGVGRSVVNGNFPRLAREGRTLWFGRWNQPTRYDVWRLDLDREGAVPELVLQTPDFEAAPQPSGDGRYYAYISSAEGQNRGFIRSAAGGPAVRIGDRRVWQLRWRGDQIFFLADGAVHAVRVVTSPDVRVEAPRRLFGAKDVGALWLANRLDVDSTGQRFVVVQTPQEFDQKMVLVENWMPAER